MQVSDLPIAALDGCELAATVFTPAGPPDRVAIISAAIAVPGTFYRHLAGYLAGQGWLALTYDYRGIAKSRPADLKGFHATARQWAEEDMAGALAWAKARYPQAEIVLIGHSFGGQAAGLLPDLSRVRAMVTISAQSGYWRLQPGFEKVKVWFYVHIVFPSLCALYGYLPWSRFARGEDLPKAAALEWASWCRLPDYLFDDPALDARRRFARFTAPILAYSVDDDVWGSAKAVEAMMAGYTAAQVERRHIHPSDAGTGRLGHLGFFLPKAARLWPAMLDWVEGQR